MLEPHARLASGVAFVNSEIRAADGTEFEEDSDVLGLGGEVSPFVSLGAGFSLKTPDHLFKNQRGSGPSLVIAAQFEGGYVLAAPVDLALREVDRDGRVALREAALGELVRSGPYLRVALSAQF
jgi:hypothetical protein